MFISTNRILFVRAFRGTLLAGLACWATSVSAGNLAAPGVHRLETIVVTAKRRPDPVADEKLTKQVEAALHSDPYFFDEHVTVTVKNGVALLEGVVFDEWDERQAIRIAKKIAGVKRVVTDFDIPDGQ
ncbi:MAG: BON domain-containing protein [Steroidobacteraceae bacterium]